LIIFLVFSRERLTEIHDEYEEREQRWNRLAILLNRDDLNIRFSQGQKST
jgi:hypothetical protein